VSGLAEYEALARRYRVPIAITGFEPIDLLEGILLTVRRLESGSFGIDNQYARSVTASGNVASRSVMDEVFEVCDRKWRGVGLLSKSGLRLREEYREFDALGRFELEAIATEEPSVCISGQVLRGIRKPSECPAFGKTCTPTSPLGATMVSSEGACAAYFAYRPLVRREGALG
jgi:hydrogenase expression/formation protein HypD